jgi:hypothetical protein
MGALAKIRGVQTDEQLASRLAELRRRAEALADARTVEDVREDWESRLAAVRGQLRREAAIDMTTSGSGWHGSPEANLALAAYLGSRLSGAIDLLLEDDPVTDRPTREQRDRELEQVRAEISALEAEIAKRARARRREELQRELDQIDDQIDEVPAA